MTTDTPLDDATLINRLKALAFDARETDGWQDAEGDILEAAVRLEGYAEWSNDVRRLSREMAVMIDGEDAARQPSLPNARRGRLPGSGRHRQRPVPLLCRLGAV